LLKTPFLHFKYILSFLFSTKFCSALWDKLYIGNSQSNSRNIFVFIITQVTTQLYLPGGGHWSKAEGVATPNWKSLSSYDTPSPHFRYFCHAPDSGLRWGGVYCLSERLLAVNYNYKQWRQWRFYIKTLHRNYYKH
jgi:hypothetical protein